MKTKYLYPDRAGYDAALKSSERHAFLWRLATE